MEESWGVGVRTQGGCGLHVVPRGQIKAHDSILGDLPPLSVKLGALSTNADQSSAGRAGANIISGSRAFHV